MKAALFWIEVVCEFCATTDCGQFVRSRIPVRDLTQDAYKSGWSLSTQGEWRCPKCTKQMIDEIRDMAGKLHGDKP